MILAIGTCTSSMLIVLSRGVCSDIEQSCTPVCRFYLYPSSRKLPDGGCGFIINCGFMFYFGDYSWSFLFYYLQGGGRVAKIVAAAAAKHLTPVTLELGGVASLINSFIYRFNWICLFLIWRQISRDHRSGVRFEDCDKEDFMGQSRQCWSDMRCTWLCAGAQGLPG